MASPKVWGPRRRKPSSGRTSRPWIVVVRYSDGKKEQKTFPATPEGKEAAEDYAAAKRLEVRAAAPALEVDRNVTVADYSARWLRRGAPKWKRGTYLQYETNVRVHIVPALGRMRVRDIHQQHLVGFLTDLLLSGLAKSTVQTLFSITRKMLKKAKFEGLVPSDPTSGVWAEVPVSGDSTGARMKAMTREQLGQFTDAVIASRLSDTLTMLWLTAAGTGMRIGEVVALRVEDLKLDKGSILVHKNLAPERYGTLEERLSTTKTSKEREVELGASLLGLLREYVKGAAPTRWLFPDEDGVPPTRNVIRYAFDKLKEAAGLPEHLTPHGLRHTYASLTLASGASIVWVANQLGHSDPAMTLRVYAWAIPSADRRWASLLDDTMSRGNWRPSATIIKVEAAVIEPNATYKQGALVSVCRTDGTPADTPRTEVSYLAQPVQPADSTKDDQKPQVGDQWRHGR